MPAKLTEGFVAEAAPPATGSTLYYDTEITGFAVRVFAPTRRHPKGARSFVLNYFSGGVERRIRIGRHPLWSAAAARKEAEGLRKQIDRGEDPAADKRARREAPTIADLAERYKAEHLPQKAQRSQRHDWQMIEKHILPRLGTRRVADIHSGDIKVLHRAISDNGTKIRANRVLSVLSKMFALSLEQAPGETAPWRDQAQGNPCKGVARNPEAGRERFFSPAELAQIGTALADLSTPAANCLKLVMLTGCRPGEAMTATWDQFDSELGYWIKPASGTKQRRAHKVPLGAGTLELIERLRAARGDDPHVFPGVAQLRATWLKVIDAAGLEAGARIYDLRHSFASVGAGRGLSLPIIGKLLGHSIPATTQRYAHLANDPLRDAANKIGAEITGKSDAEIVPIRKGGAA